MYLYILYIPYTERKVCILFFSTFIVVNNSQEIIKSTSDIVSIILSALTGYNKIKIIWLKKLYNAYINA